MCEWHDSRVPAVSARRGQEEEEEGEEEVFSQRHALIHWALQTRSTSLRPIGAGKEEFL